MSSSAIRRAAPANPVNAALATAQVFPLTSNTALACTLAVPGKLALEAKRFTVRAEGIAQVGVNTVTANISLLGALALPASPLVIGNWTLLKAGTAAAVAALACPWWFEANLIYDSISGLVNGSAGQLIANTITAAAAVTALTGVNGTNFPQIQAGPVTIQPADPVFYLAAAITFSTAAAANIGTLANFEIAF